MLNLLPTREPGAPGTVGTRGKRAVRSFVVPHIPHDDVVLPEEVQGLRAFGSETEVESIAGVLARHLETMRNKHAITLEHLRMGALKGEILDADGTLLVNLYTEFGIAPASVNFALATAGTNVKGRCLSVLRHIEDNLLGEYMTRVHCLCSPEFFDQLTSHPKVEAAYARWQEGAALINDTRAGFTFGGITRENNQALARFKRGERLRSGQKRLRRGQEIPIAVLVNRVHLRSRFDIESAVRRKLPRLAGAIQRELRK